MVNPGVYIIVNQRSQHRGSCSALQLQESVFEFMVRQELEHHQAAKVLVCAAIVGLCSVETESLNLGWCYTFGAATYYSRCTAKLVDVNRLVDDKNAIMLSKSDTNGVYTSF